MLAAVLSLCLSVSATPEQPSVPPVPPQEMQLLPPPRPLVPGTSSAAPKPHPITPSEFAGSFQPAAGNYEVTFLHPGSHEPVTVSFSLPEGAPTVRVHPREVSFDYGKHSVRIRFRIFGKVAVITD